MKKVLVLVLSCPDPPFDALMKAQEETWVSLKWPGVDVIFFYGCGPLERTGNKLIVDAPEDYQHMGWKFKRTLDVVWGDDWDFIFRTNLSSYVCQRRLSEFAQNLPTEKCYCGIPGGILNTPKENLHAAGAGMFLSRDVALILKDNLCEAGTPYVEDGECGVILNRLGIYPNPEAIRCNCDWTPKPWPDVYHYKVRTKLNNRKREAETMYEIAAMKQDLYYT